MRPRARRKIQRGSRRPEAPCSESNSHRNTDAGDERLINGHYSDLILTVSQFPIIRHLQQLEDKAGVKNSLVEICDAGRRCYCTVPWSLEAPYAEDSLEPLHFAAVRCMFPISRQS